MSRWFYHCYQNQRSSNVGVRVIGWNLMHPEALKSYIEESYPYVSFISVIETIYLLHIMEFIIYTKKLNWLHIGRHLTGKNIIQIIIQMSLQRALILNSINLDRHKFLREWFNIEGQQNRSTSFGLRPITPARQTLIN